MFAGANIDLFFVNGTMRGRFFAGRPAFFVPKPESAVRRVRVWRVSYVFPKNKYHKYH